MHDLPDANITHNPSPRITTREVMPDRTLQEIVDDVFPHLNKRDDDAERLFYGQRSIELKAEYAAMIQEKSGGRHGQGEDGSGRGGSDNAIGVVRGGARVLLGVVRELVASFMSWLLYPFHHLSSTSCTFATRNCLLVVTSPQAL